MTAQEFQENIAYLEEDTDMRFLGIAWEEKPFSAELRLYTDAGGDMIINLEELSKVGLQRYIDDFDIDKEIMLWWGESNSRERKRRGLPFCNIRDHYNDLENWVQDLQTICDNMPH